MKNGIKKLRSAMTACLLLNIVFLDENGNWLIKVDLKTGEVKGDALRVLEYGRFIEAWKS